MNTQIDNILSQDNNIVVLSREQLETVDGSFCLREIWDNFVELLSIGVNAEYGDSAREYNFIHHGAEMGPSGYELEQMERAGNCG